jgi:hypothetical protein
MGGQKIINLLDQQSIVLTPHQIKPEKELSAIIDNEICSLKHGIFNLGFIGVSSSKTGKAFAKWWAERIYYFCRDDNRYQRSRLSKNVFHSVLNGICLLISHSIGTSMIFAPAL